MKINLLESYYRTNTEGLKELIGKETRHGIYTKDDYMYSCATIKIDYAADSILLKNDFSQLNGKHIYKGIVSRCKDSGHYGKKGIRCRISEKEFLRLYSAATKCESCGFRFNSAIYLLRKLTHRKDNAGPYSAENIAFVCEECHRHIHVIERAEQACAAMGLKMTVTRLPQPQEPT